MEKIIIISLLVFILSSCKKDHVCGCSYLGGPDYKTETYHDTKYKAKKKCDELSLNAPEEASCKLK